MGFFLNETIGYAILVLSACVLSGWLFSRRLELPDVQKSIHSLDGLRGVLAVFVFIHHGMMWFHQIHSGTWGVPGASIYSNLGKGGVGLFFMITAFLFLRKVETMRGGEGAWLALLVGRLYRIMPLYLMQVLVMLVIVGWGTGLHLNEPLHQILVEISAWVLCVIGGLPNINHYKDTWIITAGVGWSLAYEWLFYFGLPIAAMVLGTRVPKKVIFVSVVGVGVIGLLIHPVISLMAAFGGGAVSFFAQKVESIRRFSKSGMASSLVLILLFISFCCWDAFMKPVPLLLSSAAFSLICMGNDIFGVLKTRALRTLGELSYAIYLFHGVFLFFLFRIAGVENFKWPPLWHWAAIAGLSPILIAACFLLNRFVERPAMNLNPFGRKRVANAHKVVPS